MVRKQVSFALPLVTYFCAPLKLSAPSPPPSPTSILPQKSSPTKDEVESTPKSLPQQVDPIPRKQVPPEDAPVKPKSLLSKKQNFSPSGKAPAPPTAEKLFAPAAKHKMVRIKTILGGDVRRFTIDEPSFATLHDHIRTSYSIPHIAIKYRDEEGDFVTLSSDSELLDAVSIAQDNGGLLRLLLHPSPIPYPYAQAPPRLIQPLRHSYPYRHHSPPPRRHAPPPPQPRHVPMSQSRHGRVPPMYPPPPPPQMYPEDIEQNTDRMLDSILGAVSWLLLGCVLYNGIPLYNTLLLVGFVSLHRRLLIRPFIKRNVVAILQARRLGPPPPHVHPPPPPHTPYALHPHPPPRTH